MVGGVGTADLEGSVKDSKVPRCGWFSAAS